MRAVLAFGTLPTASLLQLQTEPTIYLEQTQITFYYVFLRFAHK